MRGERRGPQAEANHEPTQTLRPPRLPQDPVAILDEGKFLGAGRRNADQARPHRKQQGEVPQCTMME